MNSKAQMFIFSQVWDNFIKISILLIYLVGEYNGKILIRTKNPYHWEETEMFWWDSFL